MTNHVPNLELSKRLKEAGFPQESDFWWVNQPNGGLRTSGYKWKLESKPRTRILQYEYIAAPLATELLERLPAEIKNGGKEYWLRVGKNIPYYEIGYCDNGTCLPTTAGMTLPDALAEMWLWLKENDYL